MNQAKKLTVLLLALLLCIPVLSGCGATEKSSSIVCSSALVCDWVLNVLGEDAGSYDVVVLGARGSDIHSYEPTVRDIARIARATLFVRIGGESEDWAGEVLKSADNPHLTELALCETLGDALCSDQDKQEQHEGHEQQHEPIADVHSSHEGHEHHLDEHIWFSFEYVVHSIESIAGTLTHIKPEMAELYKNNAASYIGKIRKLEGEYKALAENAECKNIVVCDRFPYLYLCEFMGLGYSAAFDGCSAESEASFSVVSRLAKKIDERQLSYVIKTESSDGAIARAVISATTNKNAKILTLDSMQSLSADDIGQKSYLGMLESNLEVLRVALTK